MSNTEISAEPEQMTGNVEKLRRFAQGMDAIEDLKTARLNLVQEREIGRAPSFCAS